MQTQCVLGLVVLLWAGLAGGVQSAHGADADPFEAANMERFPQTIPLPEIALPDLEGKQVALRSFKGQVVLMNFWTTW